MSANCFGMQTLVKDPKSTIGVQSTVKLIELFRELDRHWYYGRVDAYTATMEKIRQAIAAYDAAATRS